MRVEEPEETPDLLDALLQSIELHSRGGRRSWNGRAGRHSLEDLTVEELAERARELDIQGRSRMSKRELVAAIERDER